MSMSTHLVGILNMDEDSDFQRMLSVAKVCDTLHVEYPAEVREYFEKLGAELDTTTWEQSHEIEHDFGSPRRPIAPARVFNDGGYEGMEIDVKDIPANVKTIRFYNSW